jgi:hypothetical protein
MMRPKGDQSAFMRVPNSPKLPAINCWGIEGSCGGAARFGDIVQRIHKELPVPDFLAQYPRTVSPPEFKKIAEMIRDLLDLPREFPISPGNDIGQLRLTRLHGTSIRDFEWPGIRDVVISDKVRHLLLESRLTGWRTEPVWIPERQWPGDLAVHELVIEAEVTLVVEPPFHLRRQCPVCGRLEGEWPVPDVIRIDASSVTGADFYKAPAPMAGSILVTERVKEVLTAHQVTNVLFVPIDQACNDAIELIRNSQ